MCIRDRFALQDAVAAGGGDARRAHQWAILVGIHHGRYPDSEAVRVAHLQYKYQEGSVADDPRWGQARSEILEWMARRSGFPLIAPGTALPELPIAVASAYASALVIADWLASNEDYFPLRPRPDKADGKRTIRGLSLIHISLRLLDDLHIGGRLHVVAQAHDEQLGGERLLGVPRGAQLLAAAALGARVQVQAGLPREVLDRAHTEDRVFGDVVKVVLAGDGLAVDQHVVGRSQGLCAVGVAARVQVEDRDEAVPGDAHAGLDADDRQPGYCLQLKGITP